MKTRTGRRTANDVDAEFVVEKVVDKKPSELGGVQYKIKWAGFDNTWDTWEHETNLSCPDLIREYEKSLKGRKRKAPTTTTTPAKGRRPATKVTGVKPAATATRAGSGPVPEKKPRGRVPNAKKLRDAKQPAAAVAKHPVAAKAAAVKKPPVAPKAAAVTKPAAAARKSAPAKKKSRGNANQPAAAAAATADVATTSTRSIVVPREDSPQPAADPPSTATAAPVADAARGSSPVMSSKLTNQPAATTLPTADAATTSVPAEVKPREDPPLPTEVAADPADAAAAAEAATTSVPVKVDSGENALQPTAAAAPAADVPSTSAPTKMNSRKRASQPTASAANGGPVEAASAKKARGRPRKSVPAQALQPPQPLQQDPQPVVQQVPQLAVQQVPQLAVQQVPQPVVQQVPQLAVQQIPQPVVQQVPQLAVQQIPQPVVQPLQQVPHLQQPPLQFPPPTLEEMAEIQQQGIQPPQQVPQLQPPQSPLHEDSDVEVVQQVVKRQKKQPTQRVLPMQRGQPMQRPQSQPLPRKQQLQQRLTQRMLLQNQRHMQRAQLQHQRIMQRAQMILQPPQSLPMGQRMRPPQAMLRAQLQHQRRLQQQRFAQPMESDDSDIEVLMEIKAPPPEVLRRRQRQEVMQRLDPQYVDQPPQPLYSDGSDVEFVMEMIEPAEIIDPEQLPVLAESEVQFELEQIAQPARDEEEDEPMDEPIEEPQEEVEEGVQEEVEEEGQYEMMEVDMIPYEHEVHEYYEQADSDAEMEMPPEEQEMRDHRSFDGSDSEVEVILMRKVHRVVRQMARLSRKSRVRKPRKRYEPTDEELDMNDLKWSPHPMDRRQSVELAVKKEHLELDEIVMAGKISFGEFHFEIGITVMESYSGEEKLGIVVNCNEKKGRYLWAVDAKLEVDMELSDTYVLFDAFLFSSVKSSMKMELPMTLEEVMTEGSKYVDAEGTLLLKITLELESAYGYLLPLDFDFLRKSRAHTDTVLDVGGTPVYVNSDMLSVRSPLFYQTLHEVERDDSKMLAVRNCDADEFVIMLNVIYNRQTEITMETMIPLMYVARLFEMDNLLIRCLYFFYRHVEDITFEHLVNVIQQAFDFSDIELQTVIIKWIRQTNVFDALTKTEEYAAMTERCKMLFQETYEEDNYDGYEENEGEGGSNYESTN